MTSDETVYKPLSRNSGFRLIELLASPNVSDPIRCKLLYADLNDHPPFEALSYVWGTSPDTVSIAVDSGTLDITTSLAAALRHLRLPDTPRLIWADAICINQHNLDEKSNHVSYMAEIYRRCTKDLLWLGQNAEVLRNARAAMTFFGSISGVTSKERQMLSDEWDSKAYEELKVMEDKLEDLFARSNVWKRVWIVQELAHAPDVHLVAGDAALTWNDVEGFLQPDHYIEMYGIPDAFHGPFSHEWSIRTWAGGAIAFPQIMCHQRRLVRQSKKVEGASMLDVLSRFRYTKSTDPKDKIYALLSLVADPLSITVDYQLPTTTIYTDCMKKLIEHDGTLDPLVQSAWEMYGNKDRLEGLPSWVVDFTEPGDAHILFAQRSIFNAGGNDLALPLTVSKDSELDLTGYLIDTLASVSTEEDDKSIPIAHPGARQAFLWMPKALLLAAIRVTGNQALSEFVQSRVTDSDRSLASELDFPRCFEAFWRTMTVDVARYPMTRLAASEVADLTKLCEEWITTLFQDKPQLELNSEVQRQVYEWYNWDFGVARNGSYCRLPHRTELGDWLVVLKGAKVPVVLRKISSRDGLSTSDSVEKFEFIGSCYIHGFMDGEALEEKAGCEARSFVIV